MGCEEFSQADGLAPGSKIALVDVELEGMAAALAAYFAAGSKQGHRRRPGCPTNSMARSTHLNGVSEPNASMDVQEKNAGAATSSSRSHRHSRFLKLLSSPFPFLALLKSRSDGLLRHSPLPLPRPTRKQTTRCNSQTGKRTGSRKKNTETARGQRPEWGGHGPKWPGGVRGAGGHSWAPLRNVLLTGVSFLQTKSSRPDTSSASSCLLQAGYERARTRRQGRRRVREPRAGAETRE